MSVKELSLRLRGLAAYRNILRQPVTAALLRLLEAADAEAVCACRGELCHLLIKRGLLRSLPSAVAAEALEDDNPLTRAWAAGVKPDELLLSAAKIDLGTLFAAASLSPADFRQNFPLPEWQNGSAPFPLDHPWNDALTALAAWHRAHGHGIYAGHDAFYWDGHITPVATPDPIRLRELKGYGYQRDIAVDNTLAFINGGSANNILFYGDRGTGKSSTVKALLNEYKNHGLRMIEVPKARLPELPAVTARLAASPLRFILFIDDLSFSGNDDSFAALKAVLEGGLSACPKNVLIYATSNRRHLLKETFSDRQGDEVHHADTVQEAVSLSDRFGITLTYLLPDKIHFLEIVEQLAADHGIMMDKQKLFLQAEQWAAERGGRSPRYARQFIAYLENKQEEK